MRWQRLSKKEPLTIVLLLRKPYFFDAQELRLAAQRAWGISFEGGEGSIHGVTQTGPVSLIKAGPHLLNIFHYPKPYIDNPKENLEWLPQLSQRQAWIEHIACVGVDYMNHETDVELGYCVISKLVAEMINENCSGVYIPRESSLIPNNGSLYHELQKIASSRESGVRMMD